MVNSNLKRKITPDLQRVMLYVLIQMIHAEGLGAKSQRAYAKSLGVSVGQLSNAINAIMDALEDADVALDYPRNGAPSLREMLFSYDHACRQLEAGADPDDMILRIDEVALRPKPGWETFLRDLLPDVWNLPWAKEMWEHRKLEGWFMGRRGSEVATTQVALMVANSIFQELRIPHADLGWDSVPEELTAALPKALRSALNFGETWDVEWMVDRDRSQGSRMLHEIINILAGGSTPSVFWDFETWYVHRLRRQAGTWWLDCFTDAGDVRAWKYKELKEVDVISVSKRHLPIGVSFLREHLRSGVTDSFPATVDHPGCSHLAYPRGEQYLLDAAPSVTLTDLRSWINARDAVGAMPIDLPQGWKTYQIMPRFSVANVTDPAWTEFVTNLLKYAGRIRLRMLANLEIKAHPMLSWCTGEIDSRLLGVP